VMYSRQRNTTGPKEGGVQGKILEPSAKLAEVHAFPPPTRGDLTLS
jgi:hypothetical protein